MHIAHDQFEANNELEVNSSEGMHQEDRGDIDSGGETGQSVLEINLDELTYNPGLEKSEKSTAGIRPCSLGPKQAALILDMPTA